jgi:CheY-like chemotaxis protein
MKDRFLSSISHELRTPLNIIVGLSEMVLRDSDENESALPESLVKDIERIHTYSQHLGGLIGDVIDLATSNAGRLRLNSTLVDLGKVLQIVAETGSKMAADKGLRWETNLSETGPWVWADATRLRQVMLNLISNAIKFTSHGAVSLHIRQAEHTVTLVVQDTGIGIPLEEQQAIFDEFRQSARSIHYGYGGLGLGLAISQRIVEMHGGTISVQSSGEEGAGSTFSVTLPMVNPLSEQKDAADEATSAKPAILIIGHDRENSMRLGGLLKQRALEVSIVVVQHAYDWQRNKIEARPDAIVVDVSTDTTLGWTILREVKASQTLANTPVFFFGASDNDDALLELDYLTKPVDVAEVIKALDHHWLMTDVNKPNRTVLIVDDEPSTLEMYARIVQSHAASNRVLKAHDGREALQIMRRECIDLVLLDLQMPEMDGFQVLETMRSMESMRSVPVIVITGKVLTESDMKRLDTGIAAVLGKGLFSIEETIAHISAALERKRKLSAETRHLVRLAMGFIHQNFANPLSRGDIARHVGISEDHLTFCFRQELRTTPITYLQRYRVNQAKMLLSKSQRTITEIAHEVGFSDSSYFSRIFHREVGMSPDVFRRL